MDTKDALIEAIKAGDLAAVMTILDSEPTLADTELGGVPITLLAYYYGHEEVSKCVAGRKAKLSLFEAAALGKPISKEGDMNAYSADGFTALGFAAYFGQLESARALLMAGADPNIASSNPMGVAPLHSALSGKHYEVAELLLTSGANPNLASKEGWTPLHYAAHAGDLALTKRLLAHGAKPELQKNSEDRDAAQLAYERGADDVARLIESYYSA